jgi:hypothetical protein
VSPTQPSDSILRPHLRRWCGALALGLGLAACGKPEPRREDFPTFQAWQPFPGLDERALDGVVVVGETPATVAVGSGSIGSVRVPLPLGFTGVLPCQGGWQWGLDGPDFVAIHRAGGASSGLEVVFALELSSTMSTPERKAAAETLASLLKPLPSDARVGVVTFGAEESERRKLGPASQREELARFAAGARTADGSSLSAGLLAAEQLFDTGASEGTPGRRIVLVASPRAGTRGAEETAARLSKSGVEVSVVSLGTDRRLAKVANAGGGRFEAAPTPEHGATIGACALYAAPPTGVADAWLVASSLVGALGDLGPSVAQLRFLGLVDGRLVGIEKLEGALLEAVRDNLDPMGIVLPPVDQTAPAASSDPTQSAERRAPSEAGPQATNLLVGIGQQSVMGQWTGWQWIGENRHHARLRVGSVPGTFRRVALGARDASDRAADRLNDSAAAALRTAVDKLSEPTSLENGTPTQLFVGFLGDGVSDATGLGFAMVCTRPTCPSSKAFAAFLAELKPPSGDAKEPSTPRAGEPLRKLAGLAGFRWTSLPTTSSAPAPSAAPANAMASASAAPEDSSRPPEPAPSASGSP